MNDSVKIEPHGGACGLYRLLFWNRSEFCYLFPMFIPSMTLINGESVLRPHSLNVCRSLRDEFLTRWPSARIIITPYPI